MNTRVKTAILGLGFLGLAACGTVTAEADPTTTSVVPSITTTHSIPQTTTTVGETTTTTQYVAEPLPAPTTTSRPTTTVTPETIPTTVYYEPVYEEPAVNYEPVGINAFLECVKQRESGGDYTAVNPSSGAGGAYQFLQGTWNNTANYAGRSDLVGIHPSQASPSDQDFMAITLYNWQGPSPWAGPGCG